MRTARARSRCASPSPLPGCGMGEILVDDVKDKIERIPTVREARVELTFDPPWNQSMMSEEARLQTGMY